MADLRHQIEAEIPRLRRYARALTRDVVAADDLVQDCLLRGLAKAHLWKEGSDLRAWLFTILHNQYVNGVRRTAREAAAISISETHSAGAQAADQTRRLELRDLDRAMACLPKAHRDVILLVGVEGLRYDAVAERVGIPVGTVRSRLSRGRDVLRRLMGITAEMDVNGEVAPQTRQADAPKPRRVRAATALHGQPARPAASRTFGSAPPPARPQTDVPATAALRKNRLEKAA